MTYKQGPIAKHVDHEVLFGKVYNEDRGPNPMDPPRRRNDPLFWLRDDERKNPEVIEHLMLEKKYFTEETSDLKDTAETIYKEHISHIQETDMSAPYKWGHFLYYTREEKGKSYKIYCRVPLGKTPGKAGEEEIILDVNKMAEGKKFCDVSMMAPSPSHNLIAFSVDEMGNEVYRIQFCQPNKANATDILEGTNGHIIWGSDDSCLFYTTKDEALRDNKIWLHVLGQPQTTDVCLYAEDDPLFSVFASKSGDGNTLLIGSSSSETSEISLLDLRNSRKQSGLELIRKREKGVRYECQLHGTDTLLLLTNEGGAKNNKVILAKRSAPADWSCVVVPCSEDKLLDGIAVYKDFAVIEGRRDGLTRIWTLCVEADESFAGAKPKEFTVDEPVFTVEFLSNHTKDYDTNKFRVVYSSMAIPSTYYDVKASDHSKETVKVTEVGGGFQSSDYRCERHFATAPDGTKIPLSMVFHKDLDLSKPQPTMLYGYGSYGICMDPRFSIKYLPYLDRGMIYVVSHIRGGSEMGRLWYEIGAKYLTKRNTFSDFIASAEYLIEKKISSPHLLACEGRSAGGLLVGAVMNMRPDLFHAAVAGVPFVDVMTTMCDPSIPLTTGEWEEWGNPNEYKYFDYINSYSPIDNVRAQKYPNIIIQAGFSDPRVAYWEAAKWASKLRELKTDTNQILLNMDMDSGHFSSRDRYKFWRESSIEQAFVCKHLNARKLLFRK